MPRERNKPPISARIAALITGAMERQHLNAQELGASTRLGAATIGRLSRGESKSVSPAQAVALVRELPITMDDILEAMGYPVGASRGARIPQQLVEAWGRMPVEVRDPLLQLVLATANQTAPVTEQRQ